jgi:predicted nucleic acid-binding protein
MPMPTVFLDTNVFLYAIGAPHPLKAASQRVLERVGDGELNAVTSTEVVQEILYVLIRRGFRETGFKLARHTIELLGSLLPVTQEDISIACDLLDRYPALPTRDAIHAATMLNNGIAEIVTADGHFDEVRGIRLLPLAEWTA